MYVRIEKVLIGMKVGGGGGDKEKLGGGHSKIFSLRSTED
jgi:hypothetical protein